MKVIRQGVDPNWMKYYHKQLVLFNRTWAEIDEATTAQLLSYTQNGIVQSAVEDLPHPILMPPFENWEAELPSYLSCYADFAITRLELNVSGGAGFDVNLAGTAFASAYTSNIVSYYTHAVFPERFQSRPLNMMSLKDAPYTAMGVVTGAFEEAFRLASVQISAYRKQYYFDHDQYPVFAFIMRLLADYMELGELILVGEAAKEPIFHMLFDWWRAPNVDDIKELCLAACDFHTHRCAPGKWGAYHEFDTGAFMLTPIEILLLFKLRSLLGLENPVLDHPMMVTKLGTMPGEVGFRPDDLVARVRLRMHQDGFNESAIASM